MIHEDIPFEERAAVSQAMESRCVAELLGMARLLDFGGEVTEAQRDFLRQWLREVPRAIRCWPIPEAGRRRNGCGGLGPHAAGTGPAGKDGDAQ